MKKKKRQHEGRRVFALFFFAEGHGPRFLLFSFSHPRHTRARPGAQAANEPLVFQSWRQPSQTFSCNSRKNYLPTVHASITRITTPQNTHIPHRSHLAGSLLPSTRPSTQPPCDPHTRKSVLIHTYLQPPTRAPTPAVPSSYPVRRRRRIRSPPSVFPAIGPLPLLVRSFILPSLSVL